MSRPALWCAVLVVGLVISGATAGPAQDGAGEEPVVFRVGGWTAPLDAAWLPNGEIVTLSWDRPMLQRIDHRGGVRALRIRDDTSEYDPDSLALASDGTVLFSERGRVLRRGLDGTISTFAGRLRRARSSGDGGPAVGAGMAPTGLSVLGDGSVLIADKRNHRVRRVDPAGQITTAAGTGRDAYSGDGGPATAASLTAPYTVAAFPDGSYLIAHGKKRVRVRRVDREGRISTVAGGGQRPLNRACSSFSSSSPAKSFRIGYVDLAALPDLGFVMSADAGIFRVSADGLLSPVTCAAVGESAPVELQERTVYPTGRRASDARLPTGEAPVAVADDGTIFVGAYDERYLIAHKGSRRLAVALAPETLAAVHRGRVIAHSTAAAAAVLRVWRRGRLVTRVNAALTPGRTRLRLPRRLATGVHTLTLTAEASDGRADADALRVFGRPRLTLRMGRDIIRWGFTDQLLEGTAESRLSRCRHRGPRMVQCRLTGRYGPPGPRFSHLAAAELTRDGVPVYRGRDLRHGDRWAIVTTF